MRSSRWPGRAAPPAQRSCSRAPIPITAWDFVSGVPDQIEEVAPGYGCLGYRPSVPEVAPDIAQEKSRLVVPNVGIDKLEIGLDGAPQRIGTCWVIRR